MLRSKSPPCVGPSDSDPIVFINMFYKNYLEPLWEIGHIWLLIMQWQSLHLYSSCSSNFTGFPHKPWGKSSLGRREGLGIVSLPYPDLFSAMGVPEIYLPAGSLSGRGTQRPPTHY